MQDFRAGLLPIVNLLQELIALPLRCRRSRKRARQQRRRASDRRHQQTEPGRDVHRLRQLAYRRRFAARVTSQVVVWHDDTKRSGNLTRCVICGRRIATTYLGRRSLKKSRFLIRGTPLIPKSRILTGSRCVAGQGYVNPFIDVHRKAEALTKRAREEHEKEGELRETRLQAARAFDARCQVIRSV